MSNLGSSISPRYKQYIIPLDQSTHEFLHNDKLIWLTVIANQTQIILPPVATMNHDQKMGIHSRIRSSAPRKQSWSRSQSRSRRIGKVDEIGRHLAVRRRNPRQETQIKSNLILQGATAPDIYARRHGLYFGLGHKATAWFGKTCARRHKTWLPRHVTKNTRSTPRTGLGN